MNFFVVKGTGVNITGTHTITVPGDYTVRVIVGKDTLSRGFTVRPDPRVTLTAAEYKAQFDAATAVGARITSALE